MSLAADAQHVIRALDAYLRESAAGTGPVLRLEPLNRIVRDLRLVDYLRNGGLTGDELAAFVAAYLARTTRLHHPAYLAHQVAVPHPAGALGALIDAATNNAMAIYEMGPAAAAIEHVVINWMLTKIGWPPAPDPHTPADPAQVPAGGVLMHGGSLANLCALLAARQRLAPEAWEQGNPPNLVILAPAGAHYSVTRAAGIMGLGRDAVIPLDTDARGAIRPERVPARLRDLAAADRRVIALVANACSTAVGVYDPLDELGCLCREHDLWLHVDGAHGASALLSERLRARLQGIERARSVTWDAHKLLRAPVLCAALLVRDHRDLDATFHQEASYLFHEKSQPGVDFIGRTVECTKAGLGLRCFLVLAALGERGLARTVEGLYDRTTEAHTWLCDQAGITCPVVPESNILCFRVPGSDARQLVLRDRLLAEGRFHISTTCFQGRRYLRLVLMNPATRLEHIQALVARIRELAAEA